VLPEIREFERTSTTVVNAYIQPSVKQYLDRLVQGLAERGVKCPLLVMQSNGGVVSPQAAATRPIHIIESGPAAGVMGAMTISRQAGLDNLICFDMGGTTAKASIVEGGRTSHARECEVGAGLNAGHRLLGRGGYLVRAPILDIAEVGAGGGSIARVAEGGVLKVGPLSASSSPGPACYDRGGTEPTVTDANVVLGYLNPSSLAGGSVPIDAEAARRAIKDKIASHLHIDLIEAAHGIHRIANAMMVRAVSSVSVERGRDPRKFALFAIGGGGPVHGASLAEALDMKRVIVPPVPGLFSSLGLLFSPQEHHHVSTFWRRFAEVEEGELRQALAALAEKVTVELEQESFSRDGISIDLSADMQYVGQNAEINVSVASPDDCLDFSALREAFETEHEAQFGYRSPSEPLQFTNLRVVGRGRRAEQPFRSPRIRSGKVRPSEGTKRSMYFGAGDGWLETPVINRDELSEDFRLGPLAIEEYDSTTIVPPGSQVRRDSWGNIEIELRS
jgi:N-methylhydantoinase A